MEQTMGKKTGKLTKRQVEELSRIAEEDQMGARLRDLFGEVDAKTGKRKKKRGDKQG